MSNENSIQASAAVVRSATIEVKVIRIGNKQMTQAVFKQLVDAPLINPETLELNGSPWGFVNYHTTDCSSWVKHTHVIWERGGMLYRDEISDRNRAISEKDEAIRKLEKEIASKEAKAFGLPTDREARAQEVVALRDQLRDITDDLEAYSSRYLEVVKRLESLEQLFIAV